TLTRPLPQAVLTYRYPTTDSAIACFELLTSGFWLLASDTIAPLFVAQSAFRYKYMKEATGEGLVRGIGRLDLVAITINAIIGAGIFGLPSEVFSRTGSYSLIAFAVCALVVMLIVLCFAEVGSRFSGTGGPYLYSREVFGPVVAFEVGWLLWLARLTAFAANLNLLVSYVGFFWPSATDTFWRAVIILTVVSLLTAVNIAGVRDATIVSNIFTVGKLLPILLFIFAGLFFINFDNYSFAARPGFGEFSASVLALVYAFSGFEMAVIPAGEVRDPRRNAPLALITALLVVVLIYILIQIVCIGTLPGLATSTRPLADAGGVFLGAAGASIISAGALVSIIGNLNVIVLAGSRLPFAMAERGELPQMIARTHSRFRTPHVSILITALIMAALTLASNFVGALTISAIARLLTYAVTCAALPVLRRKPDAPPALFKAPAGVAASIASLLLAAWLLSNTTALQAGQAAMAAAFGLLIYIAYRWGRGFTKRGADHY
ncbi:MAG TPA: amino acid permease, partial [Blastocatellia bacterium]|nr:amino acid permease [Blastocatellia bacterium]